MITLNVNGKRYDVDVEPDVPLLWAIRDGVGFPRRSGAYRQGDW